eukprot:2549213-Rhodomonas_salina.1
MEETSRLVMLLENKTRSLKKALEQSMGESRRLQVFFSTFSFSNAAGYIEVADTFGFELRVEGLLDEPGLSSCIMLDRPPFLSPSHQQRLHQAAMDEAASTHNTSSQSLVAFSICLPVLLAPRGADEVSASRRTSTRPHGNHCKNSTEPTVWYHARCRA